MGMDISLEMSAYSVVVGQVKRPLTRLQKLVRRI